VFIRAYCKRVPKLQPLELRSFKNHQRRCSNLFVDRSELPHDSALEIRDEVGFFQEIRAVLAKSISEGGGKSPEELELAVRQIGCPR
jgi:hypothetical protein